MNRPLKNLIVLFLSILAVIIINIKSIYYRHEVGLGLVIFSLIFGIVFCQKSLKEKGKHSLANFIGITFLLLLAQFFI